MGVAEAIHLLEENAQIAFHKAHAMNRLERAKRARVLFKRH